MMSPGLTDTHPVHRSASSLFTLFGYPSIDLLISTTGLTPNYNSLDLQALYIHDVSEGIIFRINAVRV